MFYYFCVALNYSHIVSILKRRVPLIECVLQIVKHGEPANFVIESYWCRVAECTEEAFAMINHDVNVECYPAFAVGIDV